MSKVGIKEIAKLSGVSTGTVDRVIHGRGRVSQETAEKVKDAMRLLDYQPNLAARVLASKKSFKIAVLLPPFDQDQFWKKQLQGIKRALHNTKDFGFRADIFSFDDQKQGDLMAKGSQIINGGYQALLIAPTQMDEGGKFLELCEKHHLHYILINSLLHRQSREFLGYVGQNSHQSGLLAGKLLDLSTPTTSTFMVLHMEKEVANQVHMLEKERGFRDYFNNEKKHVVDVKWIPEANNRQMFTQEIKSILKQWNNLGGFFVSTSRIHYLAKILLEIGRTDLTIVGFDVILKNIDYLDKYKRMFLINQNPSLQGYYAVMHLFNWLLKNQKVPYKKYLPLDVITLENVQNHIHIEDRDNVEDIIL